MTNESRVHVCCGDLPRPLTKPIEGLPKEQSRVSHRYIVVEKGGKSRFIYFSYRKPPVRPYLVFGR